MSADLLFGIGMFACVFGLCMALIALGAVILGRHEDDLDQQAYTEMAAQARLRPSSDKVEAAPRDCPYDQEAELERAQAFVYALHQIDHAFPSNLRGPISDERWDALLGESRN